MNCHRTVAQRNSLVDSVPWLGEGSRSGLRASQPRQFLTKVKHNQKIGNHKREVEGRYVPGTHGMVHEEPEQHRQAQRSGGDGQGSSSGGENISPGLEKEVPFLLSSKMGTIRTANEKGNSAPPQLCAGPTLLREQGVRNGFGFILVQAVELLQSR
jgi:hypothetical protein